MGFNKTRCIRFNFVDAVFSDDLVVFEAVRSWAKPTLLLFGFLSQQSGGRLKTGKAGFMTTAVAWVLPAELTYWFVLCPLPSPLPRGEGMGWRVNSKWQRSPKWLNLSILNPLSPWERVRERAVSASLL